jgi:DNA repair protein RecO (recombination protein O)
VLEAILRRFEFELLQLLGYGVDCFYTHDSQEAILADSSYIFTPSQGFTLTTITDPNHSKVKVFNGKYILALGEGNLADIEVLKIAKQISRLAIAPLLGDKPLKSRELFINLT